MKNITKKVLALALGLMLTVGASAQIKSYSVNQNNGITKTSLAGFNCQNLKKGGVTAQTKAARVAVAVSNIQATTATVSFDKNDSTAMYIAIFATKGALNDYITNYGAYATFAALYQQGYGYAFATDTTMNVGGYTPGDTGAVFVLALESQSDTIGVYSETDFNLQNAGGTGTAVVTLTVSNIVSDGFSLSATMNDQTSYYYLGIFDSTAVDTVQFSDIQNYLESNAQPRSADITNASVDSIAARTTLAIYALPYNANHVLGTYATKYVRIGYTQVSINDVNGIRFNVYPNPATSTLNVAGDNIQRVELYNALGQRVMSQQVNGNAAGINVNNLSKGAYILKVYSNGAVSTQNVVVK